MNASGNRNAVRVGALGAILAGLALAAAPAHADRTEKHFPVQDKPKITLRNSSGRIQVKSWAKNDVHGHMDDDERKNRGGNRTGRKSCGN